MQLADLLSETLDVDSKDVWENERTSTFVRQFGVRLHTAGLSIGETMAVRNLLGIQCSHGVVWQWVHRLADSESDPLTAQPSRVTVDETAAQIGTEWYWLYAAVDLDSLSLLDVEVSRYRSTDLAATFLHGLTENFDLSETEFLTDAYDYRAALARLGLSDQVEYSDRNHSKNGFTPSNSVPTASILAGWAVDRPSQSGTNSQTLLQPAPTESSA